MLKKTIVIISLLLIILCTSAINIHAQLGAIGEFIGIGESEDESLGAVRTMSGNVMDKGRTGFGFIYQYLRFTAYDGNDLLDAFISENKYDYRKLQLGRSYFVSHGITENLTFSVFINDFTIQEKYFSWTDTNKNKLIEKDTDKITNVSNSYQDLNQIWLVNSYQIKKSSDFKIAINGILELPTSFEKNISDDATRLYFGPSFTKKFDKLSLLGDIGYTYTGLLTKISDSEGKVTSYYPGDSLTSHLALIYPLTNRFTIGGELISSYSFKAKTISGKNLSGSKTQDSLSFSPLAKFKINKNTVFYSSISTRLRDNTVWGYNYGYIFGLSYLFD